METNKDAFLFNARFFAKALGELIMDGIRAVDDNLYEFFGGDDEAR